MQLKYFYGLIPSEMAAWRVGCDTAVDREKEVYKNIS